ncbi:MAG: hypothetical protein M3367_03655 [Acidobacteriota bacterium]|nr:hypothetical protein [Acidobacteriota bacterium]
MSKFYSKLLACVAILFALCVLANIEIKADEPKPEEIIAKHLDSIGTKEKRDAVKNRIAAGVSQFESKLPTRKAAGKAVIVSDAKNLFFVTSFNSQEYPFEKIGFFAGKVSLPFVTAGKKSPLGAFIADHNNILSEGLFTGSISTTWSLLNPQIKKEKFRSAGTKKIDGRKVYALNYYTGAGSVEFTIKLYFDSQTFQHIRTEYRRIIAGKEATFGVLGQQTGVEIALTESFGDFKNADGLTLPHTYKMQYITDSNSGTYEYEWGITISKYLFNQNLAVDFFTFDEKK